MLYLKKLLNNELNRPSVEEYKSIEKNPIIIILDNIRSQHNIGAAFRSADAFAAKAIYLCGICATPPSAEIRKSALGAEESIPWLYFKESIEAVKHVIELGYTPLAIEQTHHSCSLEKFTPQNRGQYALIFGNEVRGVDQKVVDLCNGSIEIPQFGTKHSLNVSVSIGVVLWDLVNKMAAHDPDSPLYPGYCQKK